MRFLPYVHPVWQVGALALAIWALSLGLRMRGLRLRARRAGRYAGGAGRTARGAPAAGVPEGGSWRAPLEKRVALRERHARVGVAFGAAVGLGYVAGPLTLGLVRGEEVFRSAHAFFATLTLGLVVVGAGLGLRLWRGRADPGSRDLHAWCMGLALFLSLLTVMLGLALLP